MPLQVVYWCLTWRFVLEISCEASGHKFIGYISISPCVLFFKGFMPYTVLRPIGPYWRASCWELQKSIHKYAMQYWAGKVAGACCAENFRGEFGSVGLSLSWLVSWKAGVSIGCMPLLQNQKSEATQFGHSVCFFILFCCGTLRWSPNPFGRHLGPKKRSRVFGKQPSEEGNTNGPDFGVKLVGNLLENMGLWTVVLPRSLETCGFTSWLPSIHLFVCQQAF